MTCKKNHVLRRVKIDIVIHIDLDARPSSFTMTNVFNCCSECMDHVSIGAPNHMHSRIEFPPAVRDESSHRGVRRDLRLRGPPYYTPDPGRLFQEPFWEDPVEARVIVWDIDVGVIWRRF